MSSGASAPKLKGIYEVRNRLTSVQHPFHPAVRRAPRSDWVAASSTDLLSFVQEELALSAPLASKCSQCLESNEIDGEVLTSLTLLEMCTYTGLPLVSDLGSHAVESQPATGKGFRENVCRWGQILADAMASRRLFARIQFAADSGRSPAEDVQRRLQRIIDEEIKESSHSPVITAVKAGQIEAFIAALLVVTTTRLDGEDLNLLAPSEVPCLLPPWLRQGHDAVVLQLVSLVHQVRGNNVLKHMSPTLPLEIPVSTIVVIGNSGAGKSTLLNALLNEVELLPTNAMRACTASIIEIKYNALQIQGKEYTAHVQYVGLAQWEREVKEAFALVHAANAANADAANSSRGSMQAPQENTLAHEAWCKLRGMIHQCARLSTHLSGRTAVGGFSPMPPRATWAPSYPLPFHPPFPFAALRQ